jgi:hypothetical protein
MNTNTFHKTENQPRLSAIVQIIGENVEIFTVAESDDERAQILAALRRFFEQA